MTRQVNLMIVSATVGSERRQMTASGLLPRPEYLVLEEDHGVHLLDWSEFARRPARRSPRMSLAQVVSAMRGSRSIRSILSDGEHVGLPLAAALAVRPRRPGHVMIAHHLTTASKRRLLRVPGLRRSVDTFVVHGQAQVDSLIEDLGLPAGKVRLVHYGIDTRFWSPQGRPEEQLVICPGREHRDHVTFAAAMGKLDARAFVTDGSSHSPAARRRVPDHWPANVDRGSVSVSELRDLYARAALVVIPLVPTDFPAGITVALEAMAMGKAVVISATAGLRGALADEDAVVRVAPDDPVALREAIDMLLADEDRRRQLGERARRVAREHHDVGHFAQRLYDLMDGAGRHNG